MGGREEGERGGGGERDDGSQFLCTRKGNPDQTKKLGCPTLQRAKIALGWGGAPSGHRKKRVDYGEYGVRCIEHGGYED